MNNEQLHPQYKRDRQVVENLLQGDPNEYNFTELARLLIRYQGFPGASDIKNDLQKVLKSWNLNEEALYQATREIHAKGHVYKTRSADAEDWA